MRLPLNFVANTITCGLLRTRSGAWHGGFTEARLLLHETSCFKQMHHSNASRTMCTYGLADGTMIRFQLSIVTAKFGHKLLIRVTHQLRQVYFADKASWCS